MIAYKFVRWEVSPLDKLKDTFPYQMRLKVLNGEQLNRQEKNQLYRQLSNNSYSKRGIPLQGYMFDFSPILKEYLVAYNYDAGTFHRVYAPDKTSIRENEQSITRIIEP